MVEVDPFVVAGVCVALGVATVARARKPYERYSTITDLTADVDGDEGAGGSTTVRGPVAVTDPATPERTPPEPVDETSAAPALWAWRIRRKFKASGSTAGSFNWKTVEGGLSVGVFAVERDRERVRVIADSLELDPDETDDPFDSQRLFLDGPETDVPLGELDPVNKLLERLGLADEGGIVGGMEVTLSVGRNTSTPDRYQSSVIREGDELLVRGELTETADGPVLQGTEATPLTIAAGDLEEKGERLRSTAFKHVAFGLALVGVGAVFGGVHLL